MRFIKLFWDPDKEVFIDEDGFEVTCVYKWLPYWAIQLADLYRSRGDSFFTFQLNSTTIVDIFWPNEEDENWYL